MEYRLMHEYYGSLNDYDSRYFFNCYSLRGEVDDDSGEGSADITPIYVV